MKRQVEADNSQTACYAGNALKSKDLGWLPFIDAIRTFLRSEPELILKLPSLE
jgi:hypothetical protein